MLQGRGVARIFQRGGGGGGVRGDHIVSHPGYLHAPLQVFGPANGVCNYLVLEKMACLIFGFTRFRHLNCKVCMLLT